MNQTEYPCPLFNAMVEMCTSEVEVESETQLSFSEPPVIKLPSSFRTGKPRPTNPWIKDTAYNQCPTESEDN